MYLKNIKLCSVRNYKRLELGLGPGLNVFSGENGEGKTNLIEAVCMLAGLRSFRGVRAQALVHWGEKQASIFGEVGGEGARVSRARRLQVNLLKDGRQVWLDGKRPGSTKEYLLALRVLSFSPEDLFLVKEHPSHRRRFVDRSVFHASPGYIDLLGRARGAVKQLNAALKAGDQKVVATYEEVLAPLAAEVTERRRGRVEAISPLASRLYDRVLGGGELKFTYRSAAKGSDKASLEKSYRALFEKKRAEGLRKGFCTVGPQSDDLTITLYGRDIKGSASRGQSRLAMLALVLADAELYKEDRGEWPVLLLDDVASELDDRRKNALFEYVCGMGQALLTSTGPGSLNGRDCLKFKVSAGPEGANVVQA